MRASHLTIATLKETPNDAEIVSHQLMLRAGLIRKLGAGLYTWLPLGLKVLRKIELIVREEMNRAGALEILMPAVQPAELWQETGRWETFGGQLLTMKDSNGRDYCFGPTHEEVITDLIRHDLQSYKQLPLNLYQIQTKFRDEIRPRFGVMRAREFIMKDAYSFHLNQASLQQTYETMYQTYCRIFDRMGLQYRAVEADTGAIGGAVSHEFQVLADAGEDIIFYSDSSPYAANVEQATSLKPESMDQSSLPLLIQKIATLGQKTIEQLTHFLKVSADQTVKTLIVQGQEAPLVALVIRGDDELNPIKAAKHPWIKSPLSLVDETMVQQQLQIPVGSLGPVQLNIPIVVDHAARALPHFICGANEADYHFTQVVWERDVPRVDVADLRMVKVGDPSPDGQGRLQSCRGIEVGHIFQLGDKYAKAMNATVLNDMGQQQVLQMGCYGLGISRIVAAAIEQHHDARGIIWPEAIAPFTVVIIPINGQQITAVQELAESLYQRCLATGIDVLLDDRQERPGVLFADCDLMGIPHRLVISERNLKEQCIEYKARNGDEPKLITLEALPAFIAELNS